MRRLFLFLALLYCATSNAEVYRGITACSSLGDVKKIFPNASFERVKSVWVTENDGFYLLGGQGLSGSIYLAFTDSRPKYRRFGIELDRESSELRKVSLTEATTKRLSEIYEMSQFLDSRAAETDDDALAINWVRWVPATPIPLARYVTKYGPAQKTGFAENDMRPFASWPTKGVNLTLADDAKSVLSVEFSFTASETTAACSSKYNSLPKRK